MWTCSFARFVAIDVFVRDHHRDRQMPSCDPHCSWLTHFLASSWSTYLIVFAIEVLACNHHRNWRMLSCDPRRSWLAHLRASSRSTYSIVFAIEVLVRDHHRDRTSSFVLPQLDSEVIGYVALQRASDHAWWPSWNTRLRSWSWSDKFFQSIAVTIGWSNSLSCRAVMGSLIVEPRSRKRVRLSTLVHLAFSKTWRAHSASRVTLFSCGNLKRGRERDLKMLIKFTHRLLRIV